MNAIQNSYFKIVTDILGNVVMLLQAGDLLFSVVLFLRLLQPLPCSFVSIFSGVWQFLLLFLCGYLNCIAIIQFCIIFQCSLVTDILPITLMHICSFYAFSFASIGVITDIFLVSLQKSF